jgi:hypothetical protein
MAELLAVGGCYNAGRFAVDGAGANLRTWRGAINTDQEFTFDTELLILAACFDGDDMNIATNATFKLQWRNATDSGSFADLAATGEIKWSSATDLTDGNAVAAAAESGGESVDCVNKGWSVHAGLEVEGKNGVTFTMDDDEYHDIHWAIDLSDSSVGSQYEFRVTQSDNTVIGLLAGKLTSVGTPGKIDGTTKNNDRSSAVGGVTVTAYASDMAGSDPKPTGSVKSQVVSHASLGTYSLTGIFTEVDYFLHFYKDDTNDLSDGTPPVTPEVV